MAKRKLEEFNFDDIPQQETFDFGEQQLTMAEYAQQQLVKKQQIELQTPTEPTSLQQKLQQKIEQKLQDTEDDETSLTALNFLSMLGRGKSRAKKSKIKQQIAQQQWVANTVEQKQQIKQQLAEEVAQEVAEIVAEIPADDTETLLKAKKIINDIDTITEQEVLNMSMETETVEEIVDTITDVEAKDDVIEAVEIAAETVDDFDIDDLSNLEVTEIKNKTGYVKHKVTIKDSNGGFIMSQLATKLKAISNQTILHRKTDLRVIGNTNKTQLKGYKTKLQKDSYTLKPVGGLVNKSTRVIVSLDDDFNSNKQCFVYIQKSRDKFIKEYTLATEADIDWLVKYINDFYHSSFEVSKQRLNLLNQDLDPKQDEILKLMLKLTNSKKFEVTPIQAKDDESNMVGCYVKYKGTTNQWLMVEFMQYKYGYTIKCRSRIKRRWSWGMNNADGTNIFRFEHIHNSSKFLDAIEKLFTMDWVTTHGVDMQEDQLEFFESKLSYRKLKAALIYLMAGLEDDVLEKTDLLIIDALSQKDTKALLLEQGKDKFASYNTETIIGKTKTTDYFALSYLGVVGVGDDKRHGSQYITTDEYYQKYDVNDRSSYEDRRNTILKRQATETIQNTRNYNTRKYMFQLEYSVDGTKKYINGPEFLDLLQQAKIL